MLPFGRFPAEAARRHGAEPQKGKAVPRILVADDNTNIQKMVALAFEERGIDVVSVGNGEAAVRRIPDLAPDLVLADVFMPVRNGYEVCEFIKRDGRFSHVPVILLVGAFDPLDEKEARRVGADGVLKKPFVPPDPLIAMVTSALEKNPKVAAEIAKAREVPAAHAPEPVAASAPIAPPRAKTTPLPEFPQPTPEEDVEMYGFDNGRDRMGADATAEGNPPKDEAAIEAARPAEEFDEISTAADWRRNAADFEVPQELGDKMAFAPEESFVSAAFPPETDTPPISAPTTHAEKTSGASQPWLDAQASSKFNSPFLEDKSEISASPAESVTPHERRSSVEAKPAPASESAEPEKSRFNAWMDSVATPSEYAEGGWMSKIFGTRSKEKAEEKDEAPLPPTSGTSATSESVHAEVESSHRARLSAETEEKPFVNDWHAAPEPWLAPPPPPVLSAHVEPHPAPPFISPAHADDDFISASPDTTGSLRDPALELPSTPHVTPEPRLIDEGEPGGPSPFSGTSEQPEPLQSFLPPPPPERSPERTLDESHFEEPRIPEPFDTPGFAPAESSSVMNPVDERIPTVPPPNREALSDIPFLAPPSPAPLETQSTRSQDSPSVDAVVAKVLEKLEPHLHDLLSQGLLKPLVENLLQQELAKKEK